MRSLLLRLLLALACSRPAPDAQPAPSAATPAPSAMVGTNDTATSGDPSPSTAPSVTSPVASGLPPLPRHVPVTRAEGCGGDGTSSWLEARTPA